MTPWRELGYIIVAEDAVTLVQSDNSNIIEVIDLQKSYGPLRAVDGISFTVAAGEVFGILGPNGAGKTTTVEILEGMRPPDAGIARINGIDVQKDPRGVKAIIGIQLQSSAFFDNLNLIEILDLFASLYRRRADSRAILSQVELEDKAKSRFKVLSGGQQQRFSIAAALVNDPLVLFLDEPTTGLDPQARHHMWELIKEFKAQGRTVLLTTHYMEEAEELCDRVAIMDHGRIVSLDRPDNLIDGLLDRGFKKERLDKLANLEDVFLDLTGHALREE
ncbi:MAG: ABC transporter ATP-binding protein [Chloroflexi bacterium]|nr:ABC transporter ATP-binding protein [Chloroflexota bacterium]MCI0845948.1 ABC transporter ATP-binding protein [Chloroflexota bacterium]